MEEVKLEVDNSNNEKKSNSKKIWIGVVGFAILLAIIIGIVVGLGGESSPAGKSKLDISNVSMSVEYNEYLGYSAVIKGTAKNTSSRNYSYASVEFSVYDASGNNLGTALANINNLGSGDTWRFEASLFSFPSSRPTTYKLVEITAW